jgi:hypothetical protein
MYGAHCDKTTASGECTKRMIGNVRIWKDNGKHWLRLTGAHVAVQVWFCPFCGGKLRDRDQIATDGKPIGWDPIVGWADTPDGVHRPIAVRHPDSYYGSDGF